MKLLFAVLVFLLPSTVGAAGIRCNKQIVSSGDTTLEVKVACGAPAHVESTVETRTIRSYRPRFGYVERRITVPVERWTYVLGPNKFIRTLVFENGKLVAVKSEGKPPDGEPSIERCRKSIHSKGDTTAEVMLRCGPPADTHRWYEERAVGNLNYEKRVLVSFERWIYNFGPSRFLRILTFEDGRLVEIDTGDHGF